MLYELRFFKPGKRMHVLTGLIDQIAAGYVARSAISHDHYIQIYKDSLPIGSTFKGDCARNSYSCFESGMIKLIDTEILMQLGRKASCHENWSGLPAANWLDLKCLLLSTTRLSIFLLEYRDRWGHSEIVYCSDEGVFALHKQTEAGYHAIARLPDLASPNWSDDDLVQWLHQQRSLWQISCNTINVEWR